MNYRPSDGDYKYAMQLLAEEIAQEEYETDFYDLPAEVQMHVFQKAELEWAERRMDAADYGGAL